MKSAALTPLPGYRLDCWTSWTMRLSLQSSALSDCASSCAVDGVWSLKRSPSAVSQQWTIARTSVNYITRMVQVPATAAIEYVAACCRTRTRTQTKIRTKTKTVRGAYAHSPQVQCVYAQSRLSVPSIVAWRTNKQTDKQQKTDKLGPITPRGVDPRSPNFQGM